MTRGAPVHTGASQTRRLSRKAIIGYASGNFGKNILANTLVYFIIFYATDILGLAPETAGAIVLAAMIWDAVLDPVIGCLADRTHTRFGKYGPFILTGAPFASLSLVLVFLLPAHSPAPALTLLLALLTFKLFYTMIDLPHNALIARISRDSRERGTIATTRFLFSSIGSLAIAGGAFVIFSESADQATRFVGFASAAAIVSLAAMWTSWLAVAEQDRNQPASRLDWAAQLRGLDLLLRNRDALIILGVCILSGAAVPFFARSLPYFSKYNLGAETLVAPALAVLVIGQALGAPLWNLASARLEKAHALAIAHGLGITALIVFLAAPISGGPALWITLFILGVANGGIWSLVWAMAPDVVDCVERQHGVRPEAMMMALASEGMKVGLAVGAFGFGVLLEVVGYVAGAVQSPETLSGIKVVMSAPAIAGSALVALLLVGYTLTHDIHKALKDSPALRSGP